MSSKHLFVFDRYRLDEQERQLLLGTQVVPLPPKVFDLLAVLVQNAGRLLASIGSGPALPWKRAA